MITKVQIELFFYAVLNAPIHVLQVIDDGRTKERRRLGLLEERRGRWRASALVPSLGEPLLVELGDAFGLRDDAVNEVLRAHGMSR